MAVTENYSITGDFPNQRIAPTQLDEEIRASAITATLQGVTVLPHRDRCRIIFDTAITVGEKAILDAIVAAHAGDKPPSLNLRLTQSIVPLSRSVTNAVEDQGGADVNVGRSVWDLSEAVFRISGILQAPPGDVEIICVERSSGGTAQLGSLTTSAGHFSFLTTTPPSAGLNRYVVRARLVTAASANLDQVTLRLLRRRILPPTPP